jgi:hypothetical protein
MPISRPTRVLPLEPVSEPNSAYRMSNFPRFPRIGAPVLNENRLLQYTCGMRKDVMERPARCGRFSPSVVVGRDRCCPGKLGVKIKSTLVSLCLGVVWRDGCISGRIQIHVTASQKATISTNASAAKQLHDLGPKISSTIVALGWLEREN